MAHHHHQHRHLVDLTGGLHQRRVLASPMVALHLLVVIFFIILLLLLFTVFAFVVPAAESSRRSYNLEDYLPWLKKQVRSSSNLAKITSCIKDAKVNAKTNDDYKIEATFHNADFSSIQAERPLS
ncbi:hypothetical protein L7F22_023807 [Adiantum nelumboides]|nr:hypothetical protein [Adiantum nelumboides]